MVTQQTRGRLRWHTGLEEGADVGVGSVSECTTPTKSEKPDDLETAVADVVATLEVLNHELNGKLPSETITTAPTLISTDVAYALAEIVRMLRDYEARTGDGSGAEAAWMVDTAWVAVLAGDIDDVKEHLADERRAR
jgi:hypothetical protein